MASSQQPLALWTTKAEKIKYDAFADLYALIKTVDKLEKVGASLLCRGQRVTLPSPTRRWPHTALSTQRGESHTHLPRLRRRMCVTQ